MFGKVGNGRSRSQPGLAVHYVDGEMRRPWCLLPELESAFYAGRISMPCAPQAGEHDHRRSRADYQNRRTAG